MKKYLKLVSLFAAVMILLAGCKKDPPAPTASFTATVVSNVVTFEVVVTDVDQYEWNFGDNSVVSTIENPTHTYLEYGRDYTVTLVVTGPGGELTVTQTVTIPAMTKMEMLTGGASVTTGKKWRMSASAEAFRAKPDDELTVDKNYPAGVLSMLGYTTVYTDEYTFYSNGNYTITPKGTGVAAGLVYCAMNSVANVPPSADAAGAGLTLITPYTAPTGLTFALNDSKDLVVAVTADGMTTSNVTYTGVRTLSFSANGFLGLKDFMTECIVQEITATTLKIAFFVSAAPPPLPQAGKVTNVLIFYFEVVP